MIRERLAKEGPPPFLAILTMLFALGGEEAFAMAALGSMVAFILYSHRGRTYLLSLAWKDVRRKAAAWGLIVLAMSASIAGIAAPMMLNESLDKYVLDYSVGTTGRVDLVLSPLPGGNRTAYGHDDMTGLACAITEVGNVSSADPVLVGNVPVIGSGEASLLPSVEFMGAYREAVTNSEGFVATDGARILDEVGPGEAIINLRLAEALHAVPGSYIHVLHGDAAVPLRVTYIVGDAGLGGYHSRQPLLFINMNLAAHLTQTPGAANCLLVTVQQDQGIDVGRIRTVSGEIAGLLAGSYSGLGMRIETDKSQEIERNGELLRGPLGFLGLFSVFALMASVSIMASLFNLVGEGKVRERQYLRAIGLGREDLTSLELDKALLCSLPAAFAGVLMAGGLIFLFLGPLSQWSGGFMDIEPLLSAATLLRAMAMGTAAAILVVYISWPGSLLTLLWEMAGDPARGAVSLKRFGKAGPAAGVIGGISLVVLGLTAAPAVFLPAGSSLAALSLGTLPRFRRSLTVWASITVFVALAFVLSGDGELSSGSGPYGLFLFLMATFVIVPSVMMASLVIDKVLALKEGRGPLLRCRRAEVLVASRHLVEERSGTSLLVFTFALIFLLLSLSASVSSMVTENMDGTFGQADGDFDAIAVSATSSDMTAEVWTCVSSPEGSIHPDNITRITPIYSQYRTISYGGPDQQAGGQVVRDYMIIGLNEDLLGSFEMSLLAYDGTKYRNQQEVWEAVMKDPALAIIDANLMKDLTDMLKGSTEVSVGIGEEITILDGNLRQDKVTVVGVTSQRFLGGVFVGEEVLTRDMGAEGPALLLIDFNDDLDPDQQAALLGRALLNSGVTVVSKGAQLEELKSGVAQGNLVFGVFLATSIITAIIGLVTKVMRSVHERRLELAMLRTLGLSRKDQAKGLIFETSVPLIAGLLVGLFVSTALAYMVWVGLLRSGGLRFEIAWGQVLAFDLAAAVLTLITILYAATRPVGPSRPDMD